LNDLVKAAEVIQSVRMKNEELLKELDSCKDLVEPLKIENQKLLKDNNELHVEIIRVKEDIDKNSNSTFMTIKRLESEITDLRFTNQQKDKKLKDFEVEMYNLRSKHEELISKNVRGIDAPIAPKIMFNGQFNTRELPSVSNRNHLVNHDLSNELRMADEKIKLLKDKLSEQIELNKQLNNEINSGKTLVMNRDYEIKRLSSLYENNISLDKIQTQYQVEKYKRQIENLNKQLEIFNDENNKLMKENDANVNVTSKAKNNEAELVKLNRQINLLNDENNRLKSDIQNKNETVKRLTEQYNNSQKPTLYSLQENEMFKKKVEEKDEEIKKLTESLIEYQR